MGHVVHDCLCVPVDGAWFDGAYFHYGYDVGHGVCHVSCLDLSRPRWRRRERSSGICNGCFPGPRCESFAVVKQRLETETKTTRRDRGAAPSSDVNGNNRQQSVATQPVAFVAPLALVDRSRHRVDLSAAAWSAYRAGRSRREQQHPPWPLSPPAVGLSSATTMTRMV